MRAAHFRRGVYLRGMGSMLHTSARTYWALKTTARAMPHAFRKLVWELPLLCLQRRSGVYNFSCILVAFGLHGLPVTGFIAKVAPAHLEDTLLNKVREKAETQCSTTE